MSMKRDSSGLRYRAPPRSAPVGREVDVAIIGFGPVGALLAALLGRRRIRVAVIERDADVFPLPRAAHIDHQGLRLLQEIGCLGEVMPGLLPNPGLDFVTADRQLLMRLPGDLPSVSGWPASMYFHQPGFDRALRRAANQQPTVDTYLDTEMVAIEQGDHHATVVIRSPDGSADRIKARWVIGCDGASSTVRESLGIGLEDLGFHEQWLVIDLLLRRPIDTLPTRAVTVCDPSRPMTMIPIPGRRFRFELKVMPGDGDPTLLQRPEQVFQLIAGWLSEDAAEIERSAVYKFHGLVAQRWRDRRILLAGDAAHQMPPFLGQGMCSGLRDAANLAWKLDHTIRRGAPVTLLDTYEFERRTHVSQIVRAAVEYGRLICITDPVAAAERDRRWLRDPRAATERLPFKLPPLSPGPLVMDGGGGLFPQPESTTRAGARLDDVVGQRFLVLACDAAALGPSANWWAREVGATVCHVNNLPGADELRAWMAAQKTALTVVRPDRYVLARGKNLDPVTTRVETLLSAKDAHSADVP